MTKPPLTFGQWLKKLRAEQDLTQETLSELVGCATPTLRAFEIGRRRPSREMVERIADVLKVPADQRGEFLRLARLPIETALPDASAAPTANPASTMSLAPALPKPINPLIGREAECNALQHLLLAEPGAQWARLITIVGAGGMGKTRLALDVAASVSNEFAQGVAFVALAALQRAEHLPAAVAEAAGISLHGVHDLRQHVRDELAKRTLLLVLDNFEHLLADVESIGWVKEIVQHAPGVQLLITSRERLRISSERTFELGGLALPIAAARTTDQADALMLFLARAQQADSDFVLDASNRADIVRICQLLGGMPLGIELAAAWVHILSCAEIAAEIARNLDFLELADRDASPRHRNMRAVFDHSWRLLSAVEQQFLMGLSYFRGGCTRQAAEQVAGATLPLLAGLIDKSLLTRDESGRFVLHELIRQFAGEQLQRDAARAAQVAGDHAHYYSDFLQRTRSKLQSTHQPQAIHEITAELENLRLAWDWICTHRAVTLIEPYPTVLGYYFEVRGQHFAGYQLLGRWFEIDDAQGAAAPTPTQTLIEQATDDQLANWALIYGARAYAAAHSLQPAQALAGHQQALALARRSEHSHALLYTTSWAGIGYCTTGDLAQGIAYLEESVQHGRETSDPWCEALATVALGFAYLLRHDPTPAYHSLQKAYAQLRLLGDPHLLAICATQLSMAANVLGISHDAQQIMEENLHMSRQRGDRGITALWLLRLGQISKTQGKWVEAEQQLRESLDLFGEGDHTWAVSETLLTLAETLVAQGKVRQSEEYYHLTIATARANQMVTYLVEAQLGLAALWLAEGKVGEAEKIVAQAAATPQPTPKQIAIIQELRARLAADSRSQPTVDSIDRR